MTDLREYQTDLLEQVQKALEPENARVMMQLPTGGGKTIIAAHLLADYLTGGRKAVWITHRNELAGQTRWMLRNSSGVRVSPQASWSRSSPAPYVRNGVVVLMAQTATRRVDESGVWRSYGDNDYMIIDEAHHASARGWEKVLRGWPGRVLGMTATPWRLSRKEGFNHLFNELICGPQVSELQAIDFLCEAQVLMPPPNELIRGGEVGSIGDYTETGIERANEACPDVMTAGALRFWQEHAHNRKTIVYAVSVRHAWNLVRVFKEADTHVELMLGDTPLDERDATIKEFRDGNLNVLVNVAVATEGFDLPDASCIVIARPTESLALYLQMVGRGLRPKGGGDCLILDLAGNSMKHGLPEERREWSLMPRGPQSDGEAPVVWCEYCRTTSPAASHNCRRCGAPFGTDCQRCGKWRACKRWSLKSQCKLPHELVCDLCHRDAHLKAHLPVTNEMERLASQDDEVSGMVVEYNDLDKRLALLLQDLLTEERDRVLAPRRAKQDELRDLITNEDGDLRDNAVLDSQFDAYLKEIPEEHRPRNFPQKADMYAEWKGERRKALAASRDELTKLEAEAVVFDGSEVLANAQDRLVRILRREAEFAALSPEDQTAGRSRGPLRAVGVTKTDIGDGQNKRSRSRGDLLPADSYVEPMLVVLQRMGGEGRTRDVIEQVGAILADQFRPGDLERNRSGTQVVWTNRIQWQYQNLKTDGYFDPNAPRGVWRLTVEGRELAESYEHRLA